MKPSASWPVRSIVMAVAAFLAVASAAWACTSQPRIFALSSQEAPPGSEVRVTGQTVAPQGEVEVRWNDVEGPVLARTAADGTGSFSAVVRIPEARPGVYTILAVAGGEGVARSALEVTQPAAARTPADVSVPATAGDSPWRTLPEPGASAAPPASPPVAFLLGLGTVAVGMAILSFAVVSGLRRRPETARRK